MKPFARNILIAGVVAIVTPALMVAQTTKEQNTASHKAPLTQAATPATNTWFEGWYRAKYGRPSPTEEARLKAQTR